MKPRISVVIPAYNEEKYLPRCLAALQYQTFPKEHYEVIVVDNNSTDKTSAVASAHGATALFFNEIQGVSATRQHGVDAAQSDLIVFTDADITVGSDWLETIDKIMQNEHILCLSGSVYPRVSTPGISFLFWVYDGILRIHQRFGKVLPWGSNMAIRKATLTAIGGFDPHIPSAEDWDVSLRIQKKFGKSASLYYPGLRVATETRKQSDPKVFLRYIWNGVVGYWFFIVLGKKKLTKMITVR